MQNEIAAENSDSIDSVPGPEYEAVEGDDTLYSSAADPLHVNELDSPEHDAGVTASGKRTRSQSFGECEDDMQSDDTLSKKSDITLEDFKDLDATSLQLQEEIGTYANSCKRYKYDDISDRADQDIHKSELQNEKATQIQPTCSHQLVQAKTKDNTFLLVQLVDENGKTLRPPVRNVNPMNKSDLIPSPVPDKKIATTTSRPGSSDQTCRSPSLSREFVALQKSVNESKILTKFVTDITVEKARKRKTVAVARDTVNKNDLKLSTDSDIKINSKVHNTANDVNMEQVLVQQIDRAGGTYDVKPIQLIEQPQTTVLWQTEDPLVSPLVKKTSEKPRKSASSKFVPLKDESSCCQSDADSTISAKRRSRSKSFNRKFPEDPEFQSTMCKPKRYPSEENQSKRTNMRSQNSEFVKKQIDFLDQVKRQEDGIHNEDDDNGDGDDEGPSSKKESHLDSTATEVEDPDAQTSSVIDSSLNDGVSGFLGNFSSICSDRETPQSQISNSMALGTGNAGTFDKYLESVYQPAPKRGWDSFCWKCRQCMDLLPCSKCVRSFHTTCIKITAATKLDKTWICPECVAVESVLSGPKRTRRSDLSLDLLSQLLAFALKRMRNVKGMPQFMQSLTTISNFPNYFVNPVSFVTLQEKIDQKLFRCAEEFVNETKWMQHNALIAAGGISSKDTITAKAILKICRQEANEIDTCPECYHNANTRSDWFVDVCSQPHLLLWAKLKGFPYWPAKAMGLGQGAHVNVRFFGEHDRAFVPSKDCYLFSELLPNAQTGKRSARAGFTECMQEVELHIEKIRAKIGAFKYAPYKTLYDPLMELQQLEAMMPGVQEYMKRQQSVSPQKPPLQYKIVKTADNHLSIIKKGMSTADSGTESDHSLGKTAGAITGTGNHGKKKLQNHIETTGAELCRNFKNAATPNYEVISKIDDESNSSKVNSVILKRKSEYGDSTSSVRKAGDGAVDAELYLPKMTRIDEPIAEELHDRNLIENNKVGEGDSKKESSERHSIQKVNQTHPSMPPEPKVPVLTIKTNIGKVIESKAVPESAETISEIANTQNSVENLVKFKQGVTIKKLTKEDVKKKHTETLPTEKAKKQTVTKNTEIPKATKEKSNNDSNKSKANQTQGKKHILIDLVPFVEIKKELPSDDEIVVEKTTPASNTAPVKAASVVAEPAVIDAVSSHSTPPASVNPSQCVPNEPQTVPETNLVLGSIKQEQLSDEEDRSTLPKALDSDKIPEKSVDKSVVAATPSAPAAALVEPVRVVGDTTIQRVSSKSTTTTASSTNVSPIQTPQSQAVPSVVSAATTPLTGSIFSGQAQVGGTPTSMPKRATVRGVPYGPLPASATSTSKASSNMETCPSTNSAEKQKLQHQQQKPRPDQQRARKSFPNRSPTEVSPVRGGVVTSPTPLAPAVAVPANIGDPKRTLTKASMVSIPVDIANNRCSSTAAIPVPPLTAVTKIMPITCTPPITSTPPTSVTSCATAAAPTFLNCNGSTASITASLSAPPPLAGLSYNTFATTSATATLTSAASIQVMNGVASNSPAGSASSYCGNADPLGVSDFITPAMVSTITEALCRGPPRMTPRPNGPLQSDGITMFPSQAGPVCRTLVENAHKLTDFFISVMEDTMSEMSAEPEPVLQAKVAMLSIELERTKQTYEREIAEVKRTSDLMISEMRKSMENEKNRIAAEVRKQCELERKRSIEETKKKQWCANCGRESQFHCCWNTSYCDYPCQQIHWSRHASSCAQTRHSTEAVLQGAGANQMERHHGNSKSLTTITTNTSHYSSKGVVHSKKDKSLSNKSGSTVVVSNAMNANSTSTEVLKLPTNTFLRPVSSSANVRTSYPSQAPVQRFNIPLPIPAPANPGPYTLVQREGNWELMSALAPKASVTNPIAVPTNVPSQATPMSHQQHSRMVSTAGTLNTKSTARMRGGSLSTSSVALQQLGAHLSGTMQCTGGIRSTQM